MNTPLFEWLTKTLISLSSDNNENALIEEYMIVNRMLPGFGLFFGICDMRILSFELFYHLSLCVC